MSLPTTPPEADAAAPAAPLLWDVFCRVVDNFGDLGVCRRLALHLAALGHRVRLWVDDADLMQRMAPDIPARQGGVGPAAGVRPVQWVHWHPGLEVSCHEEPGDVVIEAFGCELPQAFVQRMQHRAQMAAQGATKAPAVWINLEYLSAQAYVQRSHGLPSPQLRGAGMGLKKWFFYPGFNEATGGLLREPGLLDAQQSFDAQAWLHGLGLPGPGSQERRVSLFAYPGAPLEALLDSWARAAQVDGRPVRLLLTEGPLQGRAARWWEAHPELQAAIRLSPLPWLSSQDFDHLLWSCELNFVRGEDSLVRALWAGRPFIWQLYPQDDGAHGDKLEAFWESVTGADGPDLRAPLLPWWQAWNGLAPWPTDRAFPWDCGAAWEAACQRSRSRLMQQPALAQALLRFVAQRRGPG